MSKFWIHILAALARAFHASTASAVRPGGLAEKFLASGHVIGGADSTAAVKERLTDLQKAAGAMIDDNLNIAAAANAKSEDYTIPDGQDDAGKVVKVTMVDEEMRKRFEANREQLSKLEPEITALKEALRAAEWGNEVPDQSIALKAIAAAAAANGGSLPIAPSIRKSLGQRLLESEEWKELRESAAKGQRKMTLDVGSFMRKDVYTDLPGGDIGGFGSTQRDPIVPLPSRTFRVRDLFPVVRTDSTTIEFFRVTGFNNQSSVVPERDGSAFALKPHSNLSIEGDAANVRTIAHWEVASRNVLDDEPVLRGIVENELMYGLQLTEDFQILQGSGTGQDLLGILNTPGIQAIVQSTAPSTSDDNSIDVVRRAITLGFLANYESTGVVLNPLGWEEMELGRDADGRYLLYAVAGATGAEPRLWRLPVVVTPAMPDGEGLVGAFGLGATLYDRQLANIRVAEQHDDYFVRNAVVILAEERLALATKRPESFVKITNLSTTQQP